MFFLNFISKNSNNKKKSIKTIKEKDMMIEELNKKIRFLKFEHEKKMKDVRTRENSQ